MQGRTASAWVETLGLLDEAVHFFHSGDGSKRPPFTINNFLDLLAKRLGVLRMCSQVIEDMGEGLHDTFVTRN